MLSTVLSPFLVLVEIQIAVLISWTLFDFLAMGALLIVAGAVGLIVSLKIRQPKYRIALCLVVFVAILLVWAEMAVGIFGTFLAGS